MTKSKILAVDDDQKTVDLVRLYLERVDVFIIETIKQGGMRQWKRLQNFQSR